MTTTNYTNTTYKKKTPGRRVPTRNERYMGLAFWLASFSKDPSTQYGAIIVDEVKNKVLGMGYNGPPAVYNDSIDMDWSRPEKYNDVIHSEDNAINHAGAYDLTGKTIYVTGMPCKACMLDIAKKGLKKVIYFKKVLSDPGSSCADTELFKESENIAKKGMVVLEEFKGNLNWMRDRIKWMEMVGVFD